MPYTFDPLFAADPNNPAMVAKNAAVLIFDPAVPNVAVTIADTTGSPIPNPITVNAAGFGPAFQHATLDRLGWSGGGFENYITSYEGMKQVATDAKTAAQSAASSAGASAVADVAARIAAGQFKGEPGATVLPTDDAIEAAIKGAGTKTKAALDATYSPGFAPSTAIVYDGATGNVTSSTEGGITTTFTYNTDGTVKTETRLGKVRTWAYDANGNPTSSTVV